MGLASKIIGNYWIRSGIYTLGQRFSVMFFGLFGFMILVRILPKAEFRVYALFISIITILEVLRNGFLRNGLIRALAQAETEEQKAAIRGSSLSLNYMFSAVQMTFFGAAALWLEGLWNAPGLAQMLYIQIIGSLIMPLFWHFEYVGQAIRISSLVEVPTLSVASMLFPALAKRIKDGGQQVAAKLYEQSVSAIMAITLPATAVILIFPEFIINVLAGPEYLDTVGILRVTIFYTLFIPYARQFGVVLDAIGLQKVNFYFVLFSALLNVAFNWFFISAYGTIGAAYGTLATYGVGFIYNQIYLHRKLGTNPLRTLLGMGAMYTKLFMMLRKKV